MNDINADIKLSPIEYSDQDLVVLTWALQHWHDARVTWWEHRGFYLKEWAKSHGKLSLPKTKAA